jgi:Predicted nucleotide-binding protein containing TIR-like domain
MTVSNETIGHLAWGFEAGEGPSHLEIEEIWSAQDAADYLPKKGTKAARVEAGLRALRWGRRPLFGSPQLPPDLEKLKRVASVLAETLLAYGDVNEEDVAEALEPSSPAHGAPPSYGTQPVPHTRGAVPSEHRPLTSSAPIFVVHGHHHALLHEAVRVLERATASEVTVLHEQANAGRTILEKFEAHAATASFAVVLLTGDDVGGAVGGSTGPRGRQNVIFELGFFFGRLGRDRVAVLLAPGVEQPSDIAGLVYVPVDPNGAWKYRLARELDAAGIDVAHERIP